MLLLALACASSPGKDAIPPSESADTAPDTAPDSAPDSAPDTAPDTSPDTAPDTVPDTVPDTSPDSSDDTAALPDTGRFGDFTLGDDGAFAHPGGNAPSAGDLDGDGVDELLFATADDDAPFVLLRIDAYAGTRLERTFTGATGGWGAWIVGGQALLQASGGLAYVFDGVPAADATPLTDARTTLAGTVDQAVYAGDLDGDGFGDVALQLDDPDDTVAIFSGPLPPGALTAADARTLVTGVTGWISGAGDFDGDGHADLLLQDDVVLFGPLSAGAGTAAELGAVPLTVDWPYHLQDAAVLGDLDGDGRTDVVVSDATGFFVAPGIDRTGVLAPTVSVDCFARYSEFVVDVVPGVSDPDGDGRPGLALQLSSPAGERSIAVWHDLPPTGADCGMPDERWATPRSIRYTPAPAALGGPGIDLVVTNESDGEMYPLLGVGPDGADADRDGYAAPDDCEDADPRVHPAAAETTDGRDEDCDGTPDDHPDRVAPVPAPALVGGAGNALGLRLAAWDDDGDGVPSLVVAGQTANRDGMWVVPPRGALADATGERTGWVGEDLADVGDTDGDGLSELATSEGTNAIHVLAGPLTGALDLADDPGATYTLATSERGATAAAAGDIDGDGLADLLAGAYSQDSGYGPTLTSSVFLFLGGVSGDRAEADATFSCPDGLAFGTRRGARVGDVDGDGRDDVAFATSADARVFVGVSGGVWSWDDATTTLVAPAEHILAADLDGDGLAEIALSDESARSVTVFGAPFAPGRLTAADARATLGTEEHTDAFGAALAAGQGSEGPLLLVGAPMSNGGRYQGGRVWAFADGVGARTTDDAVAGWDATAPGALFGYALTVVDVAGVPSLAIGVPQAAGAGADSGAVAVVPLP